MKKIIMLGAVGAVTMAMGTTGIACSHLARNMRNMADGNGRAAAYTVSDEAGEEYTCVFTDEDQDGICDNCYGEQIHEGSHHSSYYGGCRSGNTEFHHSKGHGFGHHHR